MNNALTTPDTDSPSPLLHVDHLKTHFFTVEGTARAVDDVSFRLDEAETLGLVGESGCGKSVTALSIMRLVKDPPARSFQAKSSLTGATLRGLQSIA